MTMLDSRIFLLHGSHVRIFRRESCEQRSMEPHRTPVWISRLSKLSSRQSRWKSIDSPKRGKPFVDISRWKSDGTRTNDPRFVPSTFFAKFNSYVRSFESISAIFAERNDLEKQPREKSRKPPFIDPSYLFQIHRHRRKRSIV